jgi:hypothetical protein
MHNYLTNKSAFFFFDNYKSFRFDVSAGVLQKILLSSILFLLYIAIFCKNLQIAYPRLFVVEFANNTNLIAVNRTFKENQD